MDNLIDLNDFSKEDVLSIFEKAEEFKTKPIQLLLKNQSLAMIFAKPSTRTRVSFEVGISQLGGHALYLNDLQLGRGETIGDTARVLSRYVDMIMARLFGHQDIIELTENASVPVINGLTDDLHPCQALADLFTIQEKMPLDNARISWVGDGASNVCHSLMQITNKFEIPLTIGCPEGFEPKEKYLSRVSNTNVVRDPKEAVAESNVVFTDTWVSMGQENRGFEALKPYQVNKELLGDRFFMHCLPAHRGHEVTNEVIDSKNSWVFDEAENRLHVQKAVMVMLK